MELGVLLVEEERSEEQHSRLHDLYSSMDGGHGLAPKPHNSSSYV
jgi:hypothetical protein